MVLQIAARHWWVFLLRGALAILFGIGAWVWPDLTVTIMVILFGAYALSDGVFSLISILFGEKERWLPELLTGVAGVAIGFITFLWPDVTALVLMYLIAAWAIVLGVLQIAGAIQLRRVIVGEWALGLAGLGSVIFGVIVAIFPGDGALALNWAVGLFAILFGLLLVVLAFRLRALSRNLRG